MPAPEPVPWPFWRRVVRALRLPKIVVQVWQERGLTVRQSIRVAHYWVWYGD